MAKTRPAAADLMPLKPADFHILMVLLDRDLHGYGIMQAIADESAGQVQLEVGSMYRIIARLTDQGLIAESRQKREPGTSRRYYRITPFGKQVARLEARRLVDVVRTARARNLVHDRPWARQRTDVL